MEHTKDRRRYLVELDRTSEVYVAAYANEMKRITERSREKDDQSMAPIRNESQIRLSKLALEIADVVSEG